MNTSKIITTDGSTLELHYEIIELNGNYGIRISASSNGQIIDEVTIKDITTLKDKIIHIFNLLSRNEVTPCTLLEVLDDIL